MSSFVLLIAIVFLGLGYFYTWLYWVIVPFFVLGAFMIQLADYQIKALIKNYLIKRQVKMSEFVIVRNKSLLGMGISFETFSLVATIRRVYSNFIPDKTDKTLYFDYEYQGVKYDFVVKLVEQTNTYQRISCRVQK